jgi:ABC-type transporter Mla maintaining outer membrane lipid asymmetry ATPase subunit MlaF
MAEAAGPVLELVGVLKQFAGLHPLRVEALRLGPDDRYVVSGLDAGSAESLVNLITGAALPDVGEVRLLGRSTRDITDSTDWLASLDRIGIVTERAVLLESLAVAANLALPLTLAVDPMAAEVRAHVTQLSGQVGLAPEALDRPVSSLTALDRMRVHLARALAADPHLLLLEHPSGRLDPAGATAFGADLRNLARGRRLAWLALSDDGRFARASGGRQVRLDVGTGRLTAERSVARLGWPWR